jgi:hypothetical protein
MGVVVDEAAVCTGSERRSGMLSESDGLSHKSAAGKVGYRHAEVSSEKQTSHDHSGRHATFTLMGNLPREHVKVIVPETV